MIEPFDLLLDHAESVPGSLAIAGEGVQITYEQLRDSAVKVAAGLRAAGVVPGSVVALAMPARLEAVFIQALFHEAAVSCTLPRRLRSAAEVGIDLVFATPDHQVDVPGVPVITVDAAWLRDLENGGAKLAPRSYGSPSALCRLVFSSGTTGSPKAVPFTVELSQFRTESARNYWMTPEPFMSLLGLPTVSGYQTYFGAITAGTTYVIPSLAATNLALMQEFEIASIKASPLQLEALVNAMAPIPTVLPHLRKIQSAGSFLPAALATRLEKVFACEVVNLYGSSELGTISVKRGNCVDPHDVGHLVPDVQAQCVDENDLPLPRGSEGRLRFCRELQASGYVGDPRSSGEHFKDGWFYPGDRGVIGPDGSLTVHGRLSDIINAAGTKVDPLVVEAHALTIAGIHDAACFKASSLNGVEQVGLAIVCDAALDVDAVAASLRLVLGNAAPLAFMRVAAIPRNDMGKVLRVQLAADFATLLAAAREP